MFFRGALSATLLWVIFVKLDRGGWWGVGVVDVVDDWLRVW